MGLSLTGVPSRKPSLGSSAKQADDAGGQISMSFVRSRMECPSWRCSTSGQNASLTSSTLPESSTCPAVVQSTRSYFGALFSSIFSSSSTSRQSELPVVVRDGEREAVRHRRERASG